MDFKKYYQRNLTYILHTDYRLEKIISLVTRLKPKRILDVGCGNGYLISLLQARPELKGCQYFGVDVYPKNPKLKYSYKTTDITKGLPYQNSSFDCVILGEVIEHVPNTDFILREIYRVLINKGHLVISTPNLVSWMNRILVPLGIQPLYTETSSEIKLGRFFKVLGQGRKTEGHLKIFTSTSLQEIIEHTGFSLKEKYGVPFFFPWPISVLDDLFIRFVSLASGLLYVAQKNSKT